MVSMCMCLFVVLVFFLVCLGHPLGVPIDEVLLLTAEQDCLDAGLARLAAAHFNQCCYLGIPTDKTLSWGPVFSLFVTITVFDLFK